jgi:hypothetical protein
LENAFFKVNCIDSKNFEGMFMFKFSFRFITHFGFLVFLATSAYAGETLNYGIHQQYIAPRAMGMGNTFSGIDDYNVMFYNPAGLAYLDKGKMNIGIGGGVSKDFIDFGKDISDVSSSDASDSDKIDQISDLLQSKYGETYSARLPRINFIYARPRWAIALVPVDLSITLMPHQLTGPALDVTAYQDTTLAFAYGKATKNKKFAWGFLTKAIYRANMERSLLAIDLAGDSDVIRDEDFKEGMTVDADVGVMWSPFINKKRGVFNKVKPTFSAVVRNIADYGFTSNFNLYNDKSSEPEKLHRRIDVGSKWELPSFSVFNPRVMVDVRDILHDYWSLEKGLHVGAELKYKVGRGLYGSLLGGMNQMYWTAGLGIQSYFFKVELTSYAEEFGTSHAKKSDRVYLAQINFNF